MRILPWLLLAGCAPASDGVILYGKPLTDLPEAWLCWRSEEIQGMPGPRSGSGLVIYADGRAEAVSRVPAWGDMGGGTTRRRGTVSAADRAELEKALAGPLAPPVTPKPEPRDGFGPETETASLRFIVEFRDADGSVRRRSYEHLSRREGGTGGEPLDPLLMRILRSLPE